MQLKKILEESSKASTGTAAAGSSGSNEAGSGGVGGGGTLVGGVTRPNVLGQLPTQPPAGVSNEIAALHEACSLCERELSQVLDSSFYGVLDMPDKGAMLNISSSLPSGAPTSEMWSAMELTGAMERYLEQVTGD